MAFPHKSIPMMTPPREQMLNAARVDEVSSEALLAVMLKTGVVGCDVFELARRLLVCFGSEAEQMAANWNVRGAWKDWVIV